MSGIVLDASAIAAWCFEDKSDPAADALLDSSSTVGSSGARGSECVEPCAWSSRTGPGVHDGAICASTNRAFSASPQKNQTSSAQLSCEAR